MAVAAEARSSHVFWWLAAGCSGAVSIPLLNINCSTAGGSAAGSGPVEVGGQIAETNGADAVREAM